VKILRNTSKNREIHPPHAAEAVVYGFGPFQLDAGARLLTRDGATVPLTPKVFDTLVVLVENSGRMVSKEELMEAVWPGTFVEEMNLTQNISVLRRAGRFGAGSALHHHRFRTGLSFRAARQPFIAGGGSGRAIGVAAAPGNHATQRRASRGAPPCAAIGSAPGGSGGTGPGWRKQEGG
jgi:hypothetical protein